MNRAAQVAAVVERATGTADLVAATGGGSVTVTVPDTAGGEVKATAANGSSFTIGLPETRGVRGVKAGAGTVVYPDAAPETDIAVQSTVDGGARVLVTLRSERAATEQRYDLGLPDGARLESDGADGYSIVESRPEGDTIVGVIDAPWAKDADGKTVDTRYRIEGKTLVQSIETSETTTYPVVADPKVS